MLRGMHGWMVVMLTATLLAATSDAADQTAPIAAPDSQAAVDWPAGLENFKTRASYALGASMAISLEGAPFELSTEALVAGLRDALAGKGRLNDEQLEIAMGEVQELTRRAMAEREEVAGFFARNAQREGVTVTASGLQYEVLRAGDGPVPGLGDAVRLNFKATTLDGRELARSPEGESVIFDVAGTMPAWREALLMMPVGSRWRLVAPAELAMGRAGGAGVRPDTPMIFDLELVGIEE